MESLFLVSECGAANIERQSQKARPGGGAKTGGNDSFGSPGRRHPAAGGQIQSPVARGAFRLNATVRRARRKRNQKGWQLPATLHQAACRTETRSRADATNERVAGSAARSDNAGYSG